MTMIPSGTTSTTKTEKEDQPSLDLNPEGLSKEFARAVSQREELFIAYKQKPLSKLVDIVKKLQEADIPVSLDTKQFMDTGEAILNISSKKHNIAVYGHCIEFNITKLRYRICDDSQEADKFIRDVITIAAEEVLGQKIGETYTVPPKKGPVVTPRVTKTLPKAD